MLLEDGTAINPYPAEFRERARRMLAEARPDHPTEFAAASHVAGRLGVNPETLRRWEKRADIDARHEPETAPEAQVEIKGQEKQIAELNSANEILRSAGVFFATELGRSSSN
jgi:transposase